jgi:DNA-directed RNA polymerase subunit N (RpoN/RPB10)
MIYITCPTCGFFIGSKTIEFETKKEEICSNNSLSEEEQAVEIQKLIKGLGLRRYCCRMRMMTCKDIVQDIVPVENN